MKFKVEMKNVHLMVMFRKRLKSLFEVQLDIVKHFMSRNEP